MGSESKVVFSYSQVSAHTTSEDCWVIINDKVYNVTSYLSEHPGGDDVILGQAGKDATQEFEDVGHGSAARLMLDEFYVGEVDPNTKILINLPSTPTKDTKEKPSKSSDNKFLHFLLALAVIALSMGFLLINFSR